MSLLKERKSLAELQEEDEQLNTEVSIAQKRAMIKKLNREMGVGSWKLFSDNGKRSGINWMRLWAWLRKH